MERLLRATRQEIRGVTLGADGAAAKADSAPAVAIVRDSDGAEAATGTATPIDEASGSYGFTLTPAQIPEVDLLRATWTAAIDSVASQKFTTTHEIVGGFMCSLEQIESGLPKGVSPSTAELRTARDWAEGWLEHECGVAFRPRYGSERLNGDGRTDLFLRRPKVLSVLAASVDGEDLDAETLEAVIVEPDGTLYRQNGWSCGRRNVAVSYVHGYEQVPEAGMRAAIKLAKFLLTPDPSNRDERATRIDTEEASYSLVTAGVRGAIFSLPEVNAFVSEYSYPSVG